MNLKLGERDATLYYEQIDDEAYQDVARSEKNGITYQLLQEKDLEQTINCLVDVFTSSEPITTAIQINASEFYPFAEIVGQKAVKDGLSQIAKDSATSQVVGAIISEDLSTELSEENSKNLPQKFDIIFQVLKELHEKYESQKKLGTDKLFHIFLLATQKQYSNIKIANNLLEKNLKIATQKGFSGAIVEVTGNISQHLFRKYGFEDRCSIDYQTYKYKGIKVFETIKEHRSCILMDKIFN